MKVKFWFDNKELGSRRMFHIPSSGDIVEFKGHSYAVKNRIWCEKRAYQLPSGRGHVLLLLAQDY